MNSPFAICNAPLPCAIFTGKDRGTCTYPLGHWGGHSAKKLCRGCGCPFTSINTSPVILGRGHGLCRDCSTLYQRQRTGGRPQNRQRAGEKHTFPCGCSGILPAQKGVVNLFAARSDTRNGWQCRVAQIINRAQQLAKRTDYKPIPADTPHKHIRKMMENPNCIACGQPLKWEFGRGKTPPLHHSHETGEPWGFTHMRCNIETGSEGYHRLREENVRLRRIIVRLRNQLKCR